MRMRVGVTPSPVYVCSSAYSMAPYNSAHYLTQFTLQGAVLITLLASCYDAVAILERIEPDPAIQHTPCAGQRVLYECHILVPSTALIWTVPASEMLIFSRERMNGDTRNSSDGNYIATLTDVMADGADTSLFMSTLLILETTNHSMLTCSGGTVANPVMESVTLTLSGDPDPPPDLSYDISVIIEDIVELQWSRPTSTGGVGVTVMEYRVTANDRTETVISSDEMVTYTSSGLIYGDVQVTAINSCGQRSDPATLTIPTSAPPDPAVLSLEFYCDEHLKCSRPVFINWEYGVQEMGVVYPREMTVSVELDPGDITCSDMTDTSCTTVITSDGEYTARVTVSNDIGSTVREETFQLTPLLVNDEDLMSTGSLSVTVNPLCRETSHLVMVTFGVQRSDGGGCEERGNVTQSLSSGESATFSTDITLRPDEKYCYEVNEQPDVRVSSSSECNDCDSEDGLTAGVAAAIAVVITAVVLLPVGVALGCCGMWYMMRRGATSGQKVTQLQAAIYEEPATPAVELANIPLTDNQAYGHVNTGKRN